MWVCEPHSVRTEVTKRGLAGLLMSKTRSPSQLSGFGSGSGSPIEADVLLHVSLLRSESTERIRRFLKTDTSFWDPGQTTCATRRGLFGFLMS